MVKPILYLLLILVLMSGCEDFKAADRFEGDVYTVAGLLIAGLAITEDHPVYITKSADIQSFDPMDIFVLEAEINVIELDTGKSWSLNPMLDIAEFKVKWIDSAENIIQPDYRYRIEVLVPGYEKLISAETTVPPATLLDMDYYANNVPGEGYSADSENMGYLIYDESDLRYPLGLNTMDKAATFNFLAELYCMEPFSTELEFTTPIFGLDNPRADMEDAYNRGGNGFRKISYLGRFASSLPPGYHANYILLKDYRQAFIFYGRYRVSTYIVDDNYYRYKYMPEGYLYGGVKNALGYFGSASGGVMYGKIVRSAPAI